MVPGPMESKNSSSFLKFIWHTASGLRRHSSIKIILHGVRKSQESGVWDAFHIIFIHIFTLLLWKFLISVQEWALWRHEQLWQVHAAMFPGDGDPIYPSHFHPTVSLAECVGVVVYARMYPGTPPHPGQHGSTHCMSTKYLKYLSMKHRLSEKPIG